MADVLALPADQRGLLTWIMRAGDNVTLAQLSAGMGQDEAAVCSTMAGLIAQGFAEQQEVDGVTRYRSRLTPTGPRRPRVPASIWSALDRPGPSRTATLPATPAERHEKPAPPAE